MAKWPGLGYAMNMHNALKALFIALPLAAGAALAADPVGTVTIAGPAKEIVLTPQQLAALPHVKVKLKIGGAEHTYEGVALSELLREAGAPMGQTMRGSALATALVVHSRDGYEVVLALSKTEARFRPEPVILADKVDGQPIDEAEGPIRLIVPGDLESSRSFEQVDRVTVRSLSTSR